MNIFTIEVKAISSNKIKRLLRFVTSAGREKLNNWNAQTLVETHIKKKFV